MSDFAIVGGVYRERCIEPLWDYIYGSAGRAMAATSRLAPGARLISYADAATDTAAKVLAAENGGTFESHSTARSVCFDYLHPLAAPRINPPPGMPQNQPITVQANVVLRYGKDRAGPWPPPSVEAPLSTHALWDGSAPEAETALRPETRHSENVTIVRERLQGHDHPHQFRQVCRLHL